eukprot:9445152-Pyramimonas_sp.AAC.1
MRLRAFSREQASMASWTPICSLASVVTKNDLYQMWQGDMPASENIRPARAFFAAPVDVDKEGPRT